MDEDVDEMARVIMLTEGYARRLEGGAIRASPSSVLIEDSGQRVLVDPGANQEALLDGFSKNGLEPDDVDLIFLTHHHLDHLLNMRLFSEIDVCDVDTHYRRDLEIPYGRLIPKTGIEVVPTPGHSPEHASLLAKTDEGRCLIAGDLFWWYDDADQKTDLKSLINLEDDLASDPVELKESRLRSLDRADLVIPGHGKPFALKADLRPGSVTF